MASFAFSCGPAQHATIAQNVSPWRSLGMDGSGGGVVERQPVAAREVADAAAEREAADPGRGDDPPGRRESERVRGMVEVAPRAAALRPHGLGGWIDADSAHPSQVDDDRTVRGAEAG